MNVSSWLRRLFAPAATTVLALGLVPMAPVLGANASAQSPSPSTASSCATPVTSAPSGPATISVAFREFGPVLVVGSGANSGCSLYYLTSDQAESSPPTFACANAGPTGEQCDINIWPALLTSGAPIAGRGVNPKLLGTVARTDVLSGQTVDQVTYAGHPLYQFLFDKAPGQTSGAGLFDSFTSTPGLWYLISPRGIASPGTAMVSPLSATVTTASGSTIETILSATLVGDNSSPPAPASRQFPVYTFSADTSHQSNCTGTCAVFWPPLLTTGLPGPVGKIGLHGLGTREHRGFAREPGFGPHGLGIIVRPDGSHQVTWDGQPLYVFVKDALPTTAPGTALGEGLGSQFGGTGFHVVTATLPPPPPSPQPNPQALALRASLAPSMTTYPDLYGVPPGGKNWSLQAGQVTLGAGGQIDAMVDGLVLTSTGANPVTQIAASVYCNGTLAGTTAPVPFSTTGNAQINSTVALPSPCLVPAVLLTITGPTGTPVYIAFDGTN